MIVQAWNEPVDGEPLHKNNSKHDTDLLDFFRVYPGLRQLVGGLIFRYCRAPKPPANYGKTKAQQKTKKLVREEPISTRGGHEGKLDLELEQSSVCLVM